MRYLYIGQRELLPAGRVVGVFDLDKCSASPRARDFLRRAQADGLVLDASGQLPRSFVVASHPYLPQIVYLSPLSASTLRARPEPWVPGADSP